jgi:hypothetical protein
MSRDRSEESAMRGCLFAAVGLALSFIYAVVMALAVPGSMN